MRRANAVSQINLGGVSGPTRAAFALGLASRQLDRMRWPGSIDTLGPIYTGRDADHALVAADELRTSLFCGKYKRDIAHTKASMRSGLGSPGTHVKDPTTHVTRGTTYENLQNLAEAFRAKVIRRYEGTRLGRQELLAEILTDVPGALWTLAGAR